MLADGKQQGYDGRQAANPLAGKNAHNLELSANVDLPLPILRLREKERQR
jgi:hypothetical protein